MPTNQVHHDHNKSFLMALARAPSYPFLGPGKYMILVAAIVLSVLDFLAQWMLGIVALFAWLLVTAYVYAYLFKVIGRSAAGDDQPPDWPDVTTEEVWRPLYLCLVTTVFAMLPCIAYLVWSVWEDEYDGGVMLALAIPGLIYLPMALLSVSLHDTPRALSPLLVIRSIVKVLPSYIPACALLMGVVYWESRMSDVVARLTFIGTLLSNALWLYLVMVVGHVLGLIYLHNERRLGWFTTD